MFEQSVKYNLAESACSCFHVAV